VRRCLFHKPYSAHGFGVANDALDWRRELFQRPFQSINVLVYALYAQNRILGDWERHAKADAHILGLKTLISSVHSDTIRHKTTPGTSQMLPRGDPDEAEADADANREA
jgi:hypothetical protein